MCVVCLKVEKKVVFVGKKMRKSSTAVLQSPLGNDLNDYKRVGIIYEVDNYNCKTSMTLVLS